MTPKLTDEQRLAVEHQGGRPVRVVDPDTQSTFYLISDDQFSQIKCLLESEPVDVRETYGAQDRSLKSVWDDVALDIYNPPDAPPSP